jgi:hypothetical protein
MTEQQDWRKLRHQQNLDRLRRTLTEHGMVESGDYADGLGPAVAGNVRLTLPHLPPDNRPDHKVCAYCIRSPRELAPRDGRPYPLCKTCAAVKQPDPKAVDVWLSLNRAERRAYVVAYFGVDPLTWQEAEATPQVTTFHEDATGMPTMAVERSAGSSRIGLMGVPRMFWHVREERGEGFAPPPPPQ